MVIYVPSLLKYCVLLNFVDTFSPNSYFLTQPYLLPTLGCMIHSLVLAPCQHPAQHQDWRAAAACSGRVLSPAALQQARVSCVATGDLVLV